MKLILVIIEEIWGMFVDDGSLAVLSVVLIAIIAALVRLAGLSGLWGGLVLGIGCLAILAYSVDRAVQLNRKAR